MKDSERAQLVLFVDQVQTLLQWVVSNEDSSVPDYLREPVSAAWGIAEDRFIVLAKAIDSKELDAELDARGLSGPELHLKLLAFRAYYESWARLRDKRQTPGAGPLARLGMLGRIFRRRPTPEPAGPAIEA